MLTALGQGLPGLIPRLDRSPAAQAREPVDLIRLMPHGSRSAATDAAPTASATPRSGWKLYDGYRVLGQRRWVLGAGQRLG